MGWQIHEDLSDMQWGYLNFLRELYSSGSNDKNKTVFNPEEFQRLKQEYVKKISDGAALQERLRAKRNELFNLRDGISSLEMELESRLTTEKNRAKPPLMQFVEKMSDPAGVDLAIVQKVVEEVQRTDQIMRCLRKEARGLARMDRSHLLGFLNTLVRLKTCFLERDMEDGVQGVQVRLS